MRTMCWYFSALREASILRGQKNQGASAEEGLCVGWPSLGSPERS